MIHIEQNQTLKDDPTVRVAAPTGDYNETDLLECYRLNDPTTMPSCMYQAQYIVLGNSVYQQSEELTEDQVAALLTGQVPDQVINNRKLIDGKDPAAKYEGAIIGRKGMKGKRVSRKDWAAKKLKQDQPIQDMTVQDKTATTTPAVVETVPTPETNTSSSTPAVSTNPVTTEASTTTPAVSTTTPAIDTSTSTPAFGTTTDQTGLDLGIGTTTPDFDMSSSTPIDLGTSTSVGGAGDGSIASTTPSIIDTGPVSGSQASSTDPLPAETSTTTEQVVSMAKNGLKNLFRL